MKNDFFTNASDENSIRRRILELSTGKVGFYSVGLYPASLAYNCAMQTDGSSLLLAPRPGRSLMGAFDRSTIEGMDQKHVSSIKSMSTHLENNVEVNNNLCDLILRCELVILSANSNHIEEDLALACKLRSQLHRPNVVFGCLSGSFSNNQSTDSSYILCEIEPELAFFSGFHRHGSLRNPLDSFTANFCHPNALTALFGAKLLDKLSPNIQVSSGVHNVEGQYLKAAKNMSSIFAGFGYEYHRSNPGVLPTLLTLLLEQCLDQAASVSMSRTDRYALYNLQPFPLTELGYGVQKIEAALVRDGQMEKVRDHTFSQLTAMVADVRGSMMLPISAVPTRNFQAGQILAKEMYSHKRCPKDIDEFNLWCRNHNLNIRALEGLKSLQFWPKVRKNYSIPLHDSSMVNLLYASIYGNRDLKTLVYKVFTESRELTNYCQESVRPTHSRAYSEAINNPDDTSSMKILVDAVKRTQAKGFEKYLNYKSSYPRESSDEIYLLAMQKIEDMFANS
ncbi:hypothetical protein [Prochlorococcus sp. MIT 1300]|uniref:hypothetical protein n=1 Tax=Prochlorococcus sp. MIT 1300 TaxID=3096218 RepID=UPI002A74FCFA|nr:hypothetical protein [Prochlorococcus sp. MIT 1300]